MHFAVHIFALFAVMAMLWVVFFVWLISTIARGVWSGVSRVAGVKRTYQPAAISGQVRCRRVRCRAMNPAGAKFCRRCGAPVSLMAQRKVAGGMSGNGVKSDEGWESRPISL
jgi:zinc ribbon protein